MIIFFSLTFNLNAASFNHQTPVNFYRIMLLNVTLIKKFSEPGFIGDELCQQKKYYTKRGKKLIAKQKVIKNKKYCLMQPQARDFVKILKKKENIIFNNQNTNQKIKPVKNKRNKFNRQHFYDKKIIWLSLLTAKWRLA